MIEAGGLFLPFKDFFDKYKDDNILNFGMPSRLEALKYVTEFDAVIDIGAHVGISVLHWAQVFKQVYAYEPMVDHYECFLKNTAHLNNVDVFNYAISNEDKILKGTYRSMKNSGSFQLVTDEWVANKPRKAGTIYDIPSKRLDSLTFNKVNLLKVDVEGWEFEVLKGAVETIKKHQPVLLIEFTGGNSRKSMRSYDVAEYNALIESLGYYAVSSIDDDTIYLPR